MKKKIIIILVFCSFLENTYSQEMLKLSKQQITEDFDFLYDKINKVNPHLAVRKLVTGWDVLEEIKKLRTLLDTVTTENGFFDIMQSSLNFCRDPHNSFVDFYPYNKIDSSEVNFAITETSRYLDEYFKWGGLPIFYIDGDYFFQKLSYPCNPYVEDCQPFKTKVPGKSKLLEVNNMQIDKYNEKWNFPIHSNVKWDYNNNKYFALSIFNPKSTWLENETIIAEDDFFVKFYYDSSLREEQISPIGMSFATEKGKYEKRVKYFDLVSILYIRIPSMDLDDISFYRDEIFKYKDKIIKKIVIDVRDNGGGNDKVWESVLSYLIKDTLSALQNLCFRNNQLVREYLEKNDIFYESETPLIIENDSLFCIQDMRYVIPTETTLGYDGKVYVLLNRDCFSSTLAFSAFCNNFENLITVGTSSGWVGGEGIMPFYFILPNSKLIFSLVCSLDGNVTDNNPESYYHDSPKIPVFLDLNDYYNIYYWPAELYNDAYLFNFDPIFQRVLDD